MLSTFRTAVRLSGNTYLQNNVLLDGVIRPGVAMALESDRFIGKTIN